MLATGNAQHAHSAIVLEAVQQLGGDEEVLRSMFLAGDVNDAGVDHALVARVHALVDLVDDAERRAREGLQRHEVEDCGHSPLASGLPVRVQDGEGFRFAAWMVGVNFGVRCRMGGKGVGGAGMEEKGREGKKDEGRTGI